MILSSAIRLLGVNVAGQPFAVKSDEVRNIRQNRGIVPNRKGNDPLGWLPGKGSKIPVIDLALRLGLKSRKREGGYLLMTGNDSGQVAFLVDRVQQSGSSHSADIHPLPLALQKNVADVYEGLWFDRDRFLFVLSLAKLGRESGVAPPNPNADQMPEPTERQKRFNTKWDTAFLSFTTVPSKISGKRAFFGLSIAQVAEVLEFKPYMTVPTAAGFLMGLIEWRNRPVPILNLNLHLGITTPPTYKAVRFLLVRGDIENQYMGFIIRPNLEVTALPVALEPTRRKIALNYDLVHGIYESDDRIVIFPRVNKMLGVDIQQ